MCACHSVAIRIPVISKSPGPAALNDQYENCPTFAADQFRFRIRCCNLSMISATYRAAKTYFIFPVFHKNASKRSINHCHPAGKGKVSPVDELLLQLQKKCPVRLSTDQYSVSYLPPCYANTSPKMLRSLLIFYRDIVYHISRIPVMEGKWAPRQTYIRSMCL